MSVVPAPSVTPGQSIAAVAAIVMAAALLLAVASQPEKWGTASAASGDACSYNCLYLP